METEADFNLSVVTDNFPNTIKNDFFSVVFSNLPSHIKIDKRYYDNYIKSIVIPDYNIQTIPSNFSGVTINHPFSKINDTLSEFQITFVLSQNAINYLNFLDWIRSLRYGDIDTTNSNLISKYFINSVDVNFLNAAKKTIATISFKDCLPTMISSLALEYGSSNEVTWTSNLKFRLMEYHTIDINAGI